MGMIINPYLVQPSVPAFTGLLDTYSGAAAAYSAARRLSSTYTGSLIRVRRSSDNTEQDIGYDSNNVLDEAALTAFIPSTTYGRVVKWYDQSGNGRDLSTSNATNQPYIVNLGTVVKDNGKPAIDFYPNYGGATINYLEGGDILDPGSNSLVTFAVAKTQDNGTLYMKSIAGNAASRYFLINESNTMYCFASSVSNANEGITTTAVTDKKLFNQEYIANTSHKLYTNNSLLATFGGTTTTIGDSSYDFRMGWYGGNLLPQRGFWQEFIVYLSDQSANRSAINGNINTFYSIY